MSVHLSMFALRKKVHIIGDTEDVYVVKSITFSSDEPEPTYHITCRASLKYTHKRESKLETAE
jgi:hypothetical protein